MNDDFHRIRRLPPYVFEEVNKAKAAARNAGADKHDQQLDDQEQRGHAREDHAQRGGRPCPSF